MYWPWRTANENCEKVLWALPLDPAPTIEQMIEACTKLTSPEVAIAQAVSKGVVEALAVSYNMQRAKPRCYNCGSFRHMIKDCPEPKVYNRNSEPVPSDCHKCKCHQRPSKNYFSSAE